MSLSFTMGITNIYNFTQEEEASGAVSENDGDEDLIEEEQWTAVRPRNKWNHESVPALSTTEARSNHKLPRRTSEEAS